MSDCSTCKMCGGLKVIWVDLSEISCPGCERARIEKFKKDLKKSLKWDQDE